MTPRRVASRSRGGGGGDLAVLGMGALVGLALAGARGKPGPPVSPRPPVSVSGSIADIRLSQDACMHVRRAEPLLKLWTDTVTIDVGVAMTALDGKWEPTEWAYQVRTGLVQDTALPTQDWADVRKRAGLYPVYSDAVVDDPGMYSQTFDLWPDDQPVPTQTVLRAVLAVLAYLNLDRWDLYQELLGSFALPSEQGHAVRQRILGQADAWTNVDENSLTNAVLIAPPMYAAGGLVKTIQVSQAPLLSRWE